MRSLRYSLLGVACTLLSASLAAAAVTGLPSSNQLYGHITSNRTLTVGSPGPNYEIIGDLTVDPGVTLTVQRGVHLSPTPYSDYLATGHDRSRVELVVQGVLLVQPGSGTVMVSSTLTANDAWSGIRVESGGNLSLSACTIADAIGGVTVEGGGQATLSGCNVLTALVGCSVLSGGHLLATHCILSDVGDGFLYAQGALGDVKACSLTGRGGGTGILLGFSPTPSDSVVPEPTLITHFSYGLQTEAAGLALDHLVISNCTYGIYDDYGSLSVTYCTLVGNTFGLFGGGQWNSIYNSILDGLPNGSLPFINTNAAYMYMANYLDSWGYIQHGGDPWYDVVTGTAISSFDPFFVAGDATYHLSPASLFTNFSVSQGQIGAYGPGPGGPTPIMAATVVSSDGSGGAAHVRWYSESNGSSKAGILRRVESGDWEPLTVLYPDGQGYVTLTDAAVTPGTRYGYGVGVQRDGRVGIEGETWVTVDLLVNGLSVATIQPNPARLSWAVSFTSPKAAASRVELIDITGRRVRDLPLTQLEAGSHTVPLSADGLPAGVYWVRVSQGGRSVLAKAVKTN